MKETKKKVFKSLYTRKKGARHITWRAPNLFLKPT